MNCIIYEGVATNAKGFYKFNVIPGMEEYSSLRNISHYATKGKKYESFDVSGDTIDNLVYIHNLNPGFVKIDTEGAEYLVFIGAMNTIKKYNQLFFQNFQII